MSLQIEHFFDQDTFSFTYLVFDDQSQDALLIDPVLGFDPVSGRVTTDHAQQVAARIDAEQLNLHRVLETHVHADHISSAQYFVSRYGARSGIGDQVHQVQAIFAGVFNISDEICVDGSQFNDLFADEARFSAGSLDVRVMHTPGHTPACVTYLIGDNAFVGDTFFMPDYGTARTDFPGGDAQVLHASLQRILSLPDDTALYMCHDYGTPQRPQFEHLTSVRAQKENVHLAGMQAADFVQAREARDAELAAPRLLYPAVQCNIRAGHLPPAERNGTRYLKIPLREA